MYTLYMYIYDFLYMYSNPRVLAAKFRQGFYVHVCLNAV